MRRELAGDTQLLEAASVRLGLARRKWRPTVLTAVLALAAQACDWRAADSRASIVSAHDAGSSDGGSSSTVAGGGGSSSILGGGGETTISLGGGNFEASGGGGAGPLPPCAVPGSPLAEQAVGPIGRQRVFYSWTTDEQVAELRAGGPLFSRSESPGKGRGLAMTELASFAENATSLEQLLAGKLADTVFEKARFAWTNPWATVLGWPGETYGNQLLEIELKPEAWIAMFTGSSLLVFDGEGQTVPIGVAQASPGRIGAIFFMSSASPSTGACGDGSFSRGGVGFREFVLGSMQMVQRWSLATPSIAARLASDIAALEAFQKDLPCLPIPERTAWTDALICAWALGSPDASPLQDYGFALGIPSEFYWPSADNLSALIAALRRNAPTGEPLIVTPEG
jgi:hypothetical protein